MSKDNSDFFKVKNEWSLIKDKLLGCYLAPYMQKILATNKRICYVDCFSGKGKFEDNQPGSPLIALKIRDDCLNKTKIFVNENGLICDFKTVQKILVELEMEGIIDIIRYPQITKNGKKSAFWEEKDGKTVTIRRLGT